MLPAYGFKLALTRVGVEVATLEDAARLMAHMRPWRQTLPHWDYAVELVLVAATTAIMAPS
jgi:hypothetical protein